MSDPSPSSPNPRDAGNWARPVDKLNISGVQAGGMRLNVQGRQLTGPIRGFGQMWQKTYWVRLSGATITPQEVIKTWKAEFPNFWPKGNRFYGPLTGIKPGEVARFTVPLQTAGLAPGVYKEYFQVVADGFTWMFDYGAFLDVNVVPPGMAAPSPVPSPTPAPEQPNQFSASGPNPFAGKPFYVEPDNPASLQALLWRLLRPGDAAQMDKIANQPTASSAAPKDSAVSSR